MGESRRAEEPVARLQVVAEAVKAPTHPKVAQERATLPAAHRVLAVAGVAPVPLRLAGVSLPGETRG